ncbi:DNA translocase FtsK [Lactobacillus sp. Sy-1]|uniref:DNA translocase FtsK n=1 Tax=Lactobacillus sp. Sy-1 TaxID=2109645 RepID=UPI001C585F9C|nr:DNA translocase FtsK [Lactobacillus sp. Sy-1]MBW1605707.1 DUF87 domain-containing protein [Lactobacillus sp. Sy-1]
MNHYDGPAFYRRFLQKPKSADNSQDSYSNNKMTSSGQVDSVNGVQTNRGNFRTNGEPLIPERENKIAEMTKAFTPKGNYARRITGDEYLHESKLGRYYLKLITELDKPDSDCILFDDGIDTRASSDVIQFGSVDEASESAAANDADDLTTPSYVDERVRNFESAVTSHYAKPTSDETYYQQLKTAQTNQSAEQPPVEPSPEQPEEPPVTPQPQSKETAPSSETVIPESTAAVPIESELVKPVSSTADDLDVDEDSATNSKGSESQTEVTESPTSQEPATKPKRGLGHSLSSILNNEHDAQKDVEFFKDELSLAKQSDADNDSGAADDAPATPIANSDDVESLPDGDDADSNAASEVIDTPSGTADAEADHDDEHEPLRSGTEYEKGYQFPRFSMLNEPQRQDDDDLDDWIIKQSEILDRTLHAFHVNAEVVDWTNGPTVTQFQVKLALGVKVSKITNLNDDLKLALAAKDIRIEAPIPGRTTVGVEIPNPKPRPVMLSEVLDAPAFQDAKSPLTIALGVDLTGKPQVTDITKMPHGLIAGATGSGKSVFINSLLISLLYKATPAQLRLLLIDPKAVELAPYNNIPHLLAPVISEPNEASAALKWAVKEMDERYEKLAAAGARNIEQFNQKAVESDQPQMQIPYIVIIIDELADLMMVASTEVQDYIVRITQKARAAGIHLIVATQRPSVDIVTGTIKNNIPTRIAFMVSSQVDSRTIIDTAGAERLLGRGDMLYLGNGKSQPLRIQGTFVTNEEIERITAAVRTQGTPQYAFNPKSLLKKVNMVQQQDELMPEVLAYIAKEKTVSTSKLQRVFSIGYNRAASLIDDLEQQNYISGQHGSKPREVYLTEDDYKKLNL